MNRTAAAWGSEPTYAIILDESEHIANWTGPYGPHLRERSKLDGAIKLELPRERRLLLRENLRRHGRAGLVEKSVPTEGAYVCMRGPVSVPHA